jgi:LPS-assembly protein
MQALALPNARFDGYYNDDALGQIEYSGSLLGVQRDADDLDTIGSTNYAFGYEGQKLHGTVQASWQKPIITTVGVVATPFLAVRADATSFSGDGSPLDSSVFALTPIAALDVRMPMISSDEAGNSAVIEPIAQMVYRATDTTLPGIVNDNAHSFVLDDTNLFSYNRFSGTDRQETGLRANVGVRYLATLQDGRWLEFVGGQSFHLSGVNGLGVADEVNTGVSTGLGEDASYIVLGARGSPSDGTTLGAKLQIDPDAARVARAGLGGDMAFGSGLTLGGDFIYLPPDAALGVTAPQEELTLRATAPLPADYWTASGSLSWDMAAGEWLEATGELLYDDGYFLAGAYAKATGPTHESPDDVSFGLKFKLKAPDGQDAF